MTVERRSPPRPAPPSTRLQRGSSVRGSRSSAFVLRVWSKPDNCGGSFSGSQEECCCGPMTKGREADLSPILREFSSGWLRNRPTPAKLFSIPGFSAILCACKSLSRCATIRFCFVPWLRFLRFGMANAVGGSTARPCNISMPGATPSGSTCWGLRRLSFPSANRRRFADRSADLRTSVAGGIGAGGCRRSGTSVRQLAEAADGVILSVYTVRIEAY